MDHKDRPDHRDLPDRRDLPGHKDPPDHKDVRGPVALRDRLELLASPDRLDRRARVGERLYSPAELSIGLTVLRSGLH